MTERDPALPPAWKWRLRMCERCEAIDVKIARYQRLANGINDKPMIEHLAAFIAGLDLEKSTLHPKPEK